MKQNVVTVGSGILDQIKNLNRDYLKLYTENQFKKSMHPIFLKSRQGGYAGFINQISGPEYELNWSNKLIRSVSNNQKSILFLRNIRDKHSKNKGTLIYDIPFDLDQDEISKIEAFLYINNFKFYKILNAFDSKEVIWRVIRVRDNEDYEY